MNIELTKLSSDELTNLRHQVNAMFWAAADEQEANDAARLDGMILQEIGRRRSERRRELIRKLSTIEQMAKSASELIQSRIREIGKRDS